MARGRAQDAKELHSTDSQQAGLSMTETLAHVSIAFCPRVSSIRHHFVLGLFTGLSGTELRSSHLRCDHYTRTNGGRSAYKASTLQGVLLVQIKTACPQQSSPPPPPHIPPIRKVRSVALLCAPSTEAYSARLSLDGYNFSTNPTFIHPTCHRNMLFRRRRRETATSWEVVEYKIVEPVPICDDDDEGKPTHRLHVLFHPLRCD